MRLLRCTRMAKSVIVFSVVLFVSSGLWLFYVVTTEPVRWQFLAAGAIHFIASIIVNKQITFKNNNYLGIAHTTLTVLFFAYGYVAL